MIDIKTLCSVPSAPDHDCLIALNVATAAMNTHARRMLHVDWDETAIYVMRSGAAFRTLAERFGIIDRESA